MPQKKGSPTSELHEPYERHSYADLRHELVLRHIRLPRSGPERLCNRAGFIKLLRDWDTNPPTPTKRTPPRRAQNSNKNQNQMTSTRAIRARRGCRFRLINVLLSPDFNGRWTEMVTRGGKIEVNRFWLDVHAAFMVQNSNLDTLHFQDALFVNVTPNVILSHSAARLVQMWIEIVAMYRNAVAQAKEAAAHNDNVHSFFDFCAGRLDLLYLHMAMLLKSKLYEFIVSDRLQAVDSVNRSKPKTVASAASALAATDNGKAVGKSTAASGSIKREEMIKASPQTVVKAVGKAKATPASSKSESTIKAAGNANGTTTPVIYTTNSGVPMQNPEMQEPLSTTVDTKSTGKTTFAKANKTGAKAKQAKPVTPIKPTGQKKPQKASGKGKAINTISTKEAKSKASPSKQKQTASQSNPKETSKVSQKKPSMGDKPAQTASLGKRPREEDDAAIVEVPTVSDIVPHSGKRVHTTTTTISTALATRPADVMLPPDEWDILESRLRKVNENIDRCHRGLASVEGNVSDSYKQSLEADLRFYSAIKQRLQEQLLVVMQSGY